MILCNFERLSIADDLCDWFGFDESVFGSSFAKRGALESNFGLRSL